MPNSHYSISEKVSSTGEPNKSITCPKSKWARSTHLFTLRKKFKSFTPASANQSWNSNSKVIVNEIE
jgi:hypothetical protein